ncbi:MAG: hypothetical protein OEZ06_03205 [Myxococcales bacterium]|nr:hypothetical protein [Myxococcales bacterium]
MQTLRSLGFFFLVLAAFGVALAACGDDSGDPVSGDGGSDGSTSDPAKNDPDSGAASDRDPSQLIAVGDGEDGSFCTRQSDCGEGLSCVEAGVDSGGRPVGICGRECQGDSDCGAEVCVGLTSNATVGVCFNFVREEFGECGIGATALCSDRSCTDDFLGYCVNLCEVPFDSDAGTADEIPASVTTAECSAGQECLGNLITFNTLGICATPVARGESCDLSKGTDCAPGDICVPVDLDDPSGDWRCFEDCTDDNTCDAGSCQDVNGVIGFCVTN